MMEFRELYELIPQLEEVAALPLAYAPHLHDSPRLEYELIAQLEEVAALALAYAPHLHDSMTLEYALLDTHVSICGCNSTGHADQLQMQES